MSDIADWLLKEADDWEPDGDLYSEGFRSPTAEKLREAAAEIARLREAPEKAREDMRERCARLLDAAADRARHYHNQAKKDEDGELADHFLNAMMTRRELAAAIRALPTDTGERSSESL